MKDNPSNQPTRVINWLIDMTYWRFKRWSRRCAECGKGRTNELGKVNFDFAFDKSKKLWHYNCQIIERKRRKEIL